MDVKELGLTGKSILKLADLSDGQMLGLVDLACELKARKRSLAHLSDPWLKGRNIVLIFEKTSTRTRCATATAIHDEGGTAEFLGVRESQIGKKESIKDTARVLGRIFDGIMFRGFLQKTVEDLAKYSGIPVWNGLTDDYHPTQVLADLMTMKEHFGRLRGLKLAYVGDGRNNVANSLMLGCAKAGVNFTNSTPHELDPNPDLVAECREIAARNGSTINIHHDPNEGVCGANAIYTDVWVSMGEEAKKAERLRLLRPYQVNAGLFDAAAFGNPEGGTIFLHCLPAFHDDQTEVSKETGALEVTDEIFSGPLSRVFDEAENRMHTIKALFVSALA
jgi:ornithine carbamoyltransferase